ncbi:O-antigen ligase family protein [Tundrisphaera lichenicola]|uniref:O-antigen ligase family protein n=1 Tax=Tundrisphaera lichenicola TaxID=2029860 RepID=UPI003EBD2E40
MSTRDPRSKPAPRTEHRPSTARPPAYSAESSGEDTFAWMGERLRRVALGLTAMLLVARAYFPSEDAETGSGLVFVLAYLGTAALAIASMLISGTTRLRWSWADGAVLTLMFLVGLSASHAPDRRPAITMAWEWGGLALMYFLARNLPRTRAESAVLAGALVATAVAVSAYGMYQVSVEFGQLRRMYNANPEGVLLRMGYAPGTPAAEAMKQRLLYSNEVFATFALANSLAGFLVGPLVLAFAVALENLKREGRGSRLVALGLAAVPGLLMLVCLILTKSRSAYIGLFVALLILAWRARRGVPPRILAISGIGLALLVGALVVVGVSTRQLDKQILTQSTLSLRYRWEYWVGAWGVITDAPSPYVSTGLGPMNLGTDEPELAHSSRTFWSGLGPANFGGPYLRHKLPEASEEVQDPHNMVLEVWAASGIWAMLALLASLAIGLRETLGPPRIDPVSPSDSNLGLTPISARIQGAPPSRSGWLIVVAGLGWIAVWVLGKLDPMSQADLLARWLILGISWFLGVVLGVKLWRRRPIPAAGLGLAVLAVSINLLAAGGIGIPAVSMMLWALQAIGLNLRDDRNCSRLRVVGGILPAALLAVVWAALAGTFYGAVLPGWKSDAALELGNAYMTMQPPAFDKARAAYAEAISSDRYAVKPWIALADLEYQFWRSPEVVKRKEPHWTKVLISMDKSLDSTAGRNPNNLALRRRQAAYARAILRDLPADAKVVELLDLKAAIARSCRWAARIYPTSAMIRAELALASADIGMYPDAVREAKQALDFDEQTPHKDKKLPAAVRESLRAQIPRWEEMANAPPPKLDPDKPKG